MKKTRLLEIIREEITAALSEVNPTIGLEEDQLDEMAYNIVLSNPEKLAKLKDEIKDSTKEGKKLLYKVIDIIQRDKKENKPIRQRDIANELGVIQQKVNPLVNLLIDYGILDKGESVTGVTKKTTTDKTQGRPTKEKPVDEPKAEKPKKEKPEKPKAEKSSKAEPKAEKTPEAEPKAKETKKDSDEDKATSAASKADKVIGGKYAAPLTPEEEDLFKTYKRQAITLANKIEDAGSADERQKLMGQLKSLKNDPEVARLFKAKGITV